MAGQTQQGRLEGPVQGCQSSMRIAGGVQEEAPGPDQVEVPSGVLLEALAHLSLVEAVSHSGLGGVPGETLDPGEGRDFAPGACWLSSNLWAGQY